ncbi:hypothetical protein GCM10022251_11380 [Phytohabitans flavus]|uniref:Carrier domain-containing protein n=2 Tax=Phytohabitans flavus TaxID=1076124 RepID=A0A6F8XJT7_9ACTN|nr:hypothetical protein Pflav_004680 [Phytohabitans flavus]
MWFLDRLTPGGAGYRICRGYEVSGWFEVEALRAAWQATVARHEALRTTLVATGGGPVQRVATEPGASFRLVDLSHVPAADRCAEADRWCAEVAAEPIDITEGPLTHLAVARLGSAVHRVVLVLHRAIADERSLSVVLGELSLQYTWALTEVGGTPAATTAPVRYADYARWQRAQEEAPLSQRRLDWWASTLTPAPPPVTLPADRGARPPSVSGGVLRFDWDGEIGERLGNLSQVDGVTPSAVLLAAYQAVLHRYGGEDRVPVGVPAEVLPPEFAGMVGPADNPLVLCGEFGGSPTFRELVAQAGRTARDAYVRRDVPFDLVVRALDVDRDARRTPLFDAVLVVRDEPETPLRLLGADVRRHEVDTGVADADLALTVDRVTPSIAGHLAYRGGDAERAWAAVLLDQLRTLLTAGLTTPDAPVAELPLDRPERLVLGRQSAHRVLPAEPVHQTARRHAVHTPTAVAVASAGSTVDYGELELRVARIAGHLTRIGAAGSAVAVRMAPGAWQLAASLAVLRSGGHIVWFGTSDVGERGRTVLAELRPACLLRVGSAAGDKLASWYRDELGGTVLDVAALDGHDAVPPPGEVGHDDPVYVAYTSGSTGKPKGIVQSHGAFAQFVTWMAEALHIGAGSRVAQWVAPEHDPSLCEAFATVVAGGTLCPVPDRIRAHPEKFVDWLVAERVTFLQTVPSFAREVLKVLVDRGPAGRPPALQSLVLMGEALPGAVVDGFREALPGVRLLNVYGPTETIAATWYEVSGPVAGSVPIGWAIPGREVLVLDGADRPCPTGVTGEIVIRSRYVARGYVGDPAGGRAFEPIRGVAADGVRSYRTGDLARKRWDGALEFRGRRDQQVKLYGNRIELGEVEAVLAEHASVAECAVVPVTDSAGLVTRLVAYVVPRPTPAGGATAGADVWRAHLRRRFGVSVTLVTFEVMDGRLPRNAGGKVDRRRLPAPHALASVARAPRTRVERELAEIWSQLGVRPVGAEEGFFAAGGHSLLVPQLVDRIQRRFGVEISLWECFTHSTLAGMAALIEAASTRGDTAASPYPADMELSPSR